MIGSKLVYRNGKVGVVENTYLIGNLTITIKTMRMVKVI